MKLVVNILPQVKTSNPGTPKQTTQSKDPFTTPTYVNQTLPFEPLYSKCHESDTLNLHTISRRMGVQL